MAGLAELDVVQQARGSLSHSKSSLLQGTQEIDEENLDKKQAAAARCPMCIEEQLHTKTLPQIQHTHTHTHNTRMFNGTLQKPDPESHKL
jgi:hypothetical protein